MIVDADQRSPLECVERIRDAINRHDLTSLTGCFADDYQNETPIHPSRSFRGRAQVRKNWGQILTAIPDLNATVVRSTRDGDMAWSEWEMRGTRIGGSAFLMRGVAIFGVAAGKATWCRFYLDEVDGSSTDIDAATASVVGSGALLTEGMQTS